MTTINISTTGDNPEGVVLLDSSTGSPLTYGVGSHGKTVSITRPANTTAYTALDAVGDTNGSAILSFTGMHTSTTGGEIMITSIELELDVTSLPAGMTGFNVRLYNASPAAIADNAAWDLVSGDRGKYLGKIVLATPVDEGGTLFIDNELTVPKQITLTGTTLYVVLQTIAGYTPAANSEVYRLTIHAIEV